MGYPTVNRVYFGSDHTGTDLKCVVHDSFSVTVPRPAARVAMNGDRPFIVKMVTFKVAAAYPAGRFVARARVSNASGSQHGDSYPGANWIASEKAANTSWTFQGLNMPFHDDGGGKIRFWLYGSGAMYVARHPGAGSFQSGGKSYSGYPIGWYQYVEVAAAPTGFTAARDAKNLNKVNIRWKKWDLKKDVDQIGGGTSIGNYVIQVARDAAFTDHVYLRNASQKDSSYAIEGLMTSTYDWWVRIAVTNEVSDAYGLKGGVWSAAIKIPASSSGGTAGNAPDPTPPDGSDDGSADVDTDDGSSGSTPSGSAGGGGGGKLTQEQKDLRNAVGRLGDAQEHVTSMQRLLAEAKDEPSADNWKEVRSATNGVASDARYITARTTGGTKTAWAAVVTAAATAYSALSDAASDANADTKDATKTAAAASLTTTEIKRVYDAVVAAKKVNTSKAWGVVGDRLKDLRKAVDKGQSYADVKAPWKAAYDAITAAIVTVNKAESKATAASTSAARTAAERARDAARKAVAQGGKQLDGNYSKAINAVVALANAVSSAVSKTPDAPEPSPGTDDGSDSGDGSSPSSPSDGGTPSKPVIVFTPIPDTTALRTRPGGLLLSRSPRIAPGHTVFLMDRGGRRRLGEFKGVTQVEWNRIRDDQSVARLVLDGTAVRKNTAVLDQIEAGRHEICIFRGDERVWEGPITLPEWKAQQVEINAKDITHYLNRTVMHGGYSNAYPNLDFVVNRIAGIIASELARKEALSPPVNILPFVHTYVQDGDARTSRVSYPAEMTVWQHLDDLAAKGGIDYTVIGRALHIWDTSRAAMGRTRVVTEQDFIGDTYISAYGLELATRQFVTDGQGNFGVAGGVDDYYGEVELVATAYDENQNPVSQDDSDPTNDTVSIEEMNEQAQRNLKGRNPTPLGVHVPDNSGFRVDRGIGMDILVPGVYMPLKATLSGKTISTMLKLKELKVTQNADGEQATVSLTPASASDFDDVEASV